MAENPYMPWHWQAYFGDTKHLTCQEHGAYDQILGTMWLAGGVLPEDDGFLMRVTKLDRRQWMRMKPTIMAFMRPLGDGNFTQNNVLDKLRVVRTRREKASDSARSRWLKLKGLPDANAMRWQCDGNAIKKRKKESIFHTVDAAPTGKEEQKDEPAVVGTDTPPAEAQQGPPNLPAAPPEQPLEVTGALLTSRLVKGRR